MKENALGARDLIPNHVLLRLVARGSYGEVWLARNIMGTFRAVKIIRQESFEQARPFERELAGLQRFEPVSRSHDGLVQILHAGWLAGGGGFFYVMELADAVEEGAEINPETYQPRTLRTEIGRHGALSVPECLDIALPLVAALHFLHERGLLHRDLKPSNIIFVNGRAKLADIGLVAGTSESHSLVGTEGFLPVEGAGTPQADIYALGKLLYEMVTGRDRLDYPRLPLAWVGDPAKTAQIEMMEIIYRACDEDWKKRHVSAAVLQAELALLQSGQSVRRVRGLERRVRWLARAGLLVGAMTVVALGAWSLTESRRRAEQAARERIEHAEAEAQRQLAKAQFARIRAGRHSGQSGCRFDSWATLRETVKHGTTPALRDEAAAVLALADMRAVAWAEAPGQTAVFAEAGPPTEWRALETGGFRHFSSGGAALSEALGVDRGKVARLVPLDEAGRCLAVWTDRPGLDVWDVKAGELALALPALAPIEVPALEASSGRLAVQGQGHEVVIYDLPRRVELARWDAGHRATSLAWRPGHHTLALRSHRSRSVILADPMTGAVTGSALHSGTVLDMAWSPDGRFLATAGADRLVRVWEMGEGEPVLLRTGRGHLNMVVGVAWHPDGDLLATTSWDGTTRLWDAPSLGPLVTEQGWGVRPRFSPDGRWLALQKPTEERVKLLEIEAGRACHHLVEPELSATQGDTVGPRAVAFDADGMALATASFDGVRLWDAASRKQTDFAPRSGCRSVSFLPEGSLFVTGSAGASVLPLSRERGDGARRFAHGGAAEELTTQTVWGGALASPATGAVFAWTQGQAVVLRQNDEETWMPLQRPPCVTALSPRGDLVATGFFRNDSSVQVWQAETRQMRWETTGGLRRPSLAFSPDGRWLVVGGIDSVTFWNAETGERGPSILRPEGADLSSPVAFSPDGRWLAIAWTRTVARLYDATTLRELVTLESPLPFIISDFAFDPAGRHLAIATEGHVTHVWDLVFLRERLRELGLDWGGA